MFKQTVSRLLGDGFLYRDAFSSSLFVLDCMLFDTSWSC